MKIISGNHCDTETSHQALLANLGQQAAFGVATLENIGVLCTEFGIDAAQAAMQEFKKICKSVLRDCDSIIEFSDTRLYFALPDLFDPNHLLLAALKIERCFATPIEYHDTTMSLDVHAGWVYCSESMLSDNAKSTALFRFVEQSRAQAMASGTRYEICSTDNVSVMDTELDVNGNIFEAIDTHALIMDYQPKYRLIDGVLVGAEALVRWRRDGIVVPPGDFIPYLSTEALWQLTRHCFRSAVRDSIDFATDTAIAINIDPACLNSNLLVLLQEELAMWDVAPSSIMLEITESGVIQNTKNSFGLLEKIRDMGIKVSIDDFGSGFSSLQRFRDLPADEIKLDRSFITNVVNDEANQNITQTLIELCHRFSKLVVAEGIEDGETVSWLLEAGCDIGQGFYLGAPMSKDTYKLLLD